MKKSNPSTAQVSPAARRVLNAVWVSTAHKFVFFSAKENCRRLTFSSAADLKQYVDLRVEEGYLVG